jgi:hypothetical protein
MPALAKTMLSDAFLSKSPHACSNLSANKLPAAALQAADEMKQIVTYGRDYFNSPWNYMDMASCIIIAMLFLLHTSRCVHYKFVRTS